MRRPRNAAWHSAPATAVPLGATAVAMTTAAATTVATTAAVDEATAEATEPFFAIPLKKPEAPKTPKDLDLRYVKNEATRLARTQRNEAEWKEYWKLKSVYDKDYAEYRRAKRRKTQPQQAADGDVELPQHAQPQVPQHGVPAQQAVVHSSGSNRQHEQQQAAAGSSRQHAQQAADHNSTDLAWDDEWQCWYSLTEADAVHTAELQMEQQLCDLHERRIVCVVSEWLNELISDLEPPTYSAYELQRQRNILSNARALLAMAEIALRDAPSDCSSAHLAYLERECSQAASCVAEAERKLESVEQHCIR